MISTACNCTCMFRTCIWHPMFILIKPDAEENWPWLKLINPHNCCNGQFNCHDQWLFVVIVTYHIHYYHCHNQIMIKSNDYQPRSTTNQLLSFALFQRLRAKSALHAVGLEAHLQPPSCLAWTDHPGVSFGTSNLTKMLVSGEASSPLSVLRIWSKL